MQNVGQIRNAVPVSKGQENREFREKKKTHSVTVSYFTYEINERFRYVASQFG